MTFTDINDPKSVTLVRGWVFNKDKQDYDPVNDFEKIFGAGLKIKNITITVTDESVSWGVVDGYLPSTLEQLRRNWKELPYSEKERINKLISFKQGE